LLARGNRKSTYFLSSKWFYHTRNISNPPTAQGFLTHAAFTPNLLYVEWSDDSVNDFIGTYPAFLPAALASPDLGSPGILTAHSALSVAAPPPINTPIAFNTINGTTLPGPYTVPAGFELDVTNYQITATYSGVVGTAQFSITFGTFSGGIVTHTYATQLFTLQKTALADNPTATQSQAHALGSVKVPAGTTPSFILTDGPAGVQYSGTITGTLMPVS
jgi:hypothetical protein